MPETLERPQEEITEIERHKYFLSEKAGCDVGWEHAAKDWDDNFAAEFRKGGAGYSDETQSSAVSGKGISMLFRRLFKSS